MLSYIKALVYSQDSKGSQENNPAATSIDRGHQGNGNSIDGDRASDAASLAREDSQGLPIASLQLSPKAQRMHSGEQMLLASPSNGSSQKTNKGSRSVRHKFGGKDKWGRWGASLASRALQQAVRVIAGMSGFEDASIRPQQLRHLQSADDDKPVTLSVIIEEGGHDLPVKVTMIRPKAFQTLRWCHQITGAELLASMCGKGGPKPMRPSTSRSGEQFMISYDKSFIVKTVSVDEMHFLEQSVSKFAAHAEEYPSTLHPRFCCAVTLSAPGLDALNALIMGNVFAGIPANLRLQKFDIKGSSFQRSHTDASSSTNKDLMQPTEAGDEEITLRDLDLKAPVALGNLCPLVKEQLAADLSVLQELQLTDYSLLIGVTMENVGDTEAENGLQSSPLARLPSAKGVDRYPALPTVTGIPLLAPASFDSQITFGQDTVVVVAGCAASPKALQYTRRACESIAMLFGQGSLPFIDRVLALDLLQCDALLNKSLSTAAFPCIMLFRQGVEKARLVGVPNDASILQSTLAKASSGQQQLASPCDKALYDNIGLMSAPAPTSRCRTQIIGPLCSLLRALDGGAAAACGTTVGGLAVQTVHLGIVDTLQVYDWRRRIEQSWKTVVRGGVRHLTVLEPPAYAQRLAKFINTALTEDGLGKRGLSSPSAAGHKTSGPGVEGNPPSLRQYNISSYAT